MKAWGAFLSMWMLAVAGAQAQGYAAALRGISEWSPQCRTGQTCADVLVTGRWQASVVLSAESPTPVVLAKAAQGPVIGAPGRAETDMQPSDTTPLAGTVKLSLNDSLAWVGRVGLNHLGAHRHAISGVQQRARMSVQPGFGLAYSLGNGLDLTGGVDLAERPTRDGTDRQLQFGAGAQVKF
jgi:hypothetical protein